MAKTTPFRCPVCGGEEVTTGPLQSDGYEAYQDSSCDNCGETYKEYWRWVGTSLDTPPDHPSSVILSALDAASAVDPTTDEEEKMAQAAEDTATLIIRGGFDADKIIASIPFIEQAFPASAGRTGTTITLDFTDEEEAARFLAAINQNP